MGDRIKVDMLATKSCMAIFNVGDRDFHTDDGLVVSHQELGEEVVTNISMPVRRFSNQNTFERNID